MSGFEISRFVGLSESMAKHMSCSLCLGIYCEPVQTQCGHTFCQQCIKQWINENNNSCPQCQQQFPNKKIRITKSNDNSIDESVMFWETNRNFVNLINDLKIKCDFVLKGCNEVLELGLLSDHLEKCDYNYCKTCGLKMGKKDEHNCIELLKKDRNQFKQLFIETQSFAEKYKHDLNDNKNQPMTKSSIFDEKIQKFTERIDELMNEKLDFEKERQELIEKISSLEKIIANNNNEKTANVLNYFSVSSSSAPVLANDCDKRTESNEVVNECNEKRKLRNNKLVECIIDGKVDIYLIGLYREFIPSERHLKFKSGSNSGRNHAKHNQCFGPIDEVKQMNIIYDYLTQLFAKNFKNDEKFDTKSYILEVWTPEAIVKAISIDAEKGEPTQQIQSDH